MLIPELKRNQTAGTCSVYRRNLRRRKRCRVWRRKISHDRREEFRNGEDPKKNFEL
nr:hypothetical protein Iba_chr11eCG14900 [Ipomoea batatas]